VRFFLINNYMEYVFYSLGGIAGLAVLCIICKIPLDALDNCIKDEEGCCNSNFCRKFRRCICCEEENK
jgi:hypothetical protein